MSGTNGITRYVSERELVFSPNTLGFPSISGCHAIAYLTDAGLFGYHSLGGETRNSYEARADFFGNFVSGHPSRGATGRALYAACFLSAGPRGARGYAEPRRANWVAELTAYAQAVNFTGPIYGYDLGQFPGIGGSAYVEITRVGRTCVMQVRSWVDHEEQRGTVTDHENIRYLLRDTGPLQSRTGTTIVGVGTAKLTTVYPEQLR
jgi:hypothetical protein